MVIIFIFFAHVSLLVEKFSIYMTTACALLSFLFSYNNTHIFFCMTIYFFLITCFVYLYFSFLAFSYILFPSNHRSWIVYYFSYGIMLWLRYRSKWWSIFFILCIYCSFYVNVKESKCRKIGLSQWGFAWLAYDRHY